MAGARQFIEWIKRGPETATDKDVRAYFLYLREEKQLAPSTINVATPPTSLLERIRAASGWLMSIDRGSSMPRRLGPTSANRQAAPIFRARGFL